MVGFMLQYFTVPVFTALSILVDRPDKSFLIHLLEPSMKQCLTGDLRSLGFQYE